MLVVRDGVPSLALGRRAARDISLEAVISQRICVQELELNLTSYLLFRGSELIGFERFFDLDLITVDKL